MKELFFALSLSAASLAMAQEAPCENPVTKSEVLTAQKSWGDAIVAIGHSEHPRHTAMEAIDRLYGYDEGSVLFKPTLAREHPFRANKETALSYFVGGVIEEDKEFALAPYTHVRFENEDIITNCDTALSMGEYYFTKPDGKEIEVEYSFAYFKDKNGDLKINLHHSSLPYQGQ